MVEDITAIVSVNGDAVGNVKLADVTTGFTVKATKKAMGLLCTIADDLAAEITITEGFAAGIVEGDSFVVTFRNIPDGVTVTIPGDGCRAHSSRRC